MIDRSREFLRKLGLPLMVLALFTMLGGHLGMVQVVAWSTMLWDYSRQENSLLAGAEKTFSGEAPCAMCKAVEKSRQEEERRLPATLKLDKKAEVLADLKRAELRLPALGEYVRRASETHPRPASRDDAPPAPVPLLG